MHVYLVKNEAQVKYFHVITLSIDLNLISIQSCSYDYVMIDDGVTLHKYCGDWTDRIKLLRSISSNITINIVTDSTHTQRGFRAELRLTNRPINSEKALCDNQRFRHFSHKCYLVSTYPEVSWPTAHRICNDIQSELININSITDENAFISLLLGKNCLKINLSCWIQISHWINSYFILTIHKVILLL